MTDEETYTQQLDREAVAKARRKPFPDRSRVRRVVIDDDARRSIPHELARQRMAEGDDGVSHT
jgi:hypothetical protein